MPKLATSPLSPRSLSNCLKPSSSVRSTSRTWTRSNIACCSSDASIHGDRLIGYDDLWFQHQTARHHDPLALFSAQLMRATPEKVHIASPTGIEPAHLVPEFSLLISPLVKAALWPLKRLTQAHWPRTSCRQL